ncbi:hypothetical protein SRS16CHR_03944 [Variovorax sp. SRS16]|uniref:MotA/TolQ/ExbB proton channel family protein n=1 Tax=Variovorax sp. SRS16 TaxID=282217 RepID=UPI001316B84E|nr:MotA/TolQ/ExbB proton channel family protein [Variovorax sp. SRS16]VTU26858.1 hypothetical protein SRS16CHR_03944 [Variovorax sp. SRS16]
MGAEAGLRAAGRRWAAGRPRRAVPAPEPLWFEWLALAGAFAFATWLLGARGVWALLLRSDPTGITLAIVIVFAAATLWCGARARVLQAQRVALGDARARGAAAACWAADYWRVLSHDKTDADTALDLLMERTHGAHAAAWWVNGAQLKLGLLGKVIGFSILALDIGNTQSFDPAQSQDLLRSLTAGLGVALLTTMVGLVGNILLGLQLTRLDRYADQLVADIQRIGLAGQTIPGA